MRNQRAAQWPAAGQSKQHTVVSLFSGCGGMDLGFRGGFPFGGKFHQRLPFEVVWANDINESACDTYAANLGEDHLHRGSIVDVMDTLPESADVVVGGFPCQDVSINGQRSAANGARTILYQRMIDVIRHCQPAVFVAENVKGLLMSHGRPFFNRMLADFRLPGYTVDHRLYLAADYGVPQMRERIFIVGVRGNVPFAHPAALAHQMRRREQSNRPHLEQGAAQSRAGKPALEGGQARHHDSRRAPRQRAMALQARQAHLAARSGAAAILPGQLRLRVRHARHRTTNWQRRPAGASLAHRQGRSRAH